MKPLPLESIAKELEEEKSIRINPLFLGDNSPIDAPVLKEVDVLLDAIDEKKGLKLTTKGNLPTRVVKAIDYAAPIESDKIRLEVTKRHLEEESRPAMRARSLCEIGSLVKPRAGKLHRGKFYEAYRIAPDSHKLVYLLYRMNSFNLGYLDSMQENELLNALAMPTLQMLRDKPQMYRSVEAYMELLFGRFPLLAGFVEDEIVPEFYTQKDPYKTFEYLMEVRLFKHFFVPFGFADERGFSIDEAYEVRKTALLDAVLVEVDAIDESKVLTKKVWSRFAGRVKKEQLDIDLFYDFCHLYVGGAYHLSMPTEALVKDIIKARRVIGTEAQKEKEFYTDLTEAVEQTLRYFTQMEVKGGGERGDEMMQNFQSFIDGIYSLLPKDRPYRMVESIRSAGFFLLDLLITVFKIDMKSEDPLKACSKMFDEETCEDIATALYLLGNLETKGRKLKRVNTRFETMVKEALTAWVLAVMSIRSELLDKRVSH